MTDENMGLIVSFLERIETRQNRIDDHVDETNAILGRLTATVEIHEKRSTNLENIVASCRGQCDARIQTVNELSQRVERTVDKFTAALKWTGILLGGCAGAVGVIAAIIQIAEKIK